MKLLKIFLLMYLTLLSPSLFAQEKVDQQIIGRIKEEGFQHSKVMETLSWLSDVYGPRFFASPDYREAAEWAEDQLKKYGLENVKLEPLDGNFRGWSAESFSVEMIKPKYTPISAWPAAFTKSTDGVITGAPLFIKPKFNGNNPPLDSLEKYRGKLKGKIVFWDLGYQAKPHFEPFALRWTQEELQHTEQAINPIAKEPLEPWTAKLPIAKRLAKGTRKTEKRKKLLQFFAHEGVAALIFPSSSDHAIIHAGKYNLPGINDIKAVPTFFIAREQFGRIVRMADKKVLPTIRLHLETTFYENPKNNVNIFAEITGTDKKLASEVVLLGAHFDSWHAGTGATDNAAGCAIMMEALRILKTIGIRPRRTIRLALWAGEEMGYLGSRDFSEKYLGNLDTGKLKDNLLKISAYFNLDVGSGKIRGIYLQGNKALRSVFKKYLAPFDYLSANTLSIENTSYTDHEILDAFNVPAFQFIQDPLNYETVTHHTNLDVYKYVLEDDLKKNAVIIAALAYQVAMRDEMLPRKNR